MVNIQIVGQGISAHPRIPQKLLQGQHAVEGRLPARQAYFGPQVGWLETPVLRRDDLETAYDGPCIVEEYDATCVVPPNATACLDAYGNLLIHLR